MKKLIIILTLFTTIVCRAEEWQMKYKAGQTVQYKVPFFFSEVCKDTGVITDYWPWVKSYKIAAVQSNNLLASCPNSLDIKETDILKVIK